jgi:hypothetical protein
MNQSLYIYIDIYENICIYVPTACKGTAWATSTSDIFILVWKVTGAVN